MCYALGIEIIAANSLQAKGRIERNHGTHQDRLVKKLRRLGVADIDAANVFLAETYWPDHNHRSARPPASPKIVRYHNRLLQLELPAATPVRSAPSRRRPPSCDHPEMRPEGGLSSEGRGHF